MARLASILRRLRRGEARDLLGGLIRSAVPRWLFYRYEMVIIRTTTVRPLPRPMSHITIRWAGPEEEATLQRIRPRREGYGQRFRDGWRCMVGEVGGEPASLCWYDLGEWHDSRVNGFRFRLGPRACWSSFLYVRPDFRLSGVFYKHWFESMRLLAEEGVLANYGSVQAENEHAIESYLRIGSELIYRYRVLRVAGLIHHVARPVEASSLPPSRGWGRWKGGDPSGPV